MEETKMTNEFLDMNKEAKEFKSRRICLSTRNIEDISENEKPINWKRLVFVD